MTKKYYAERNYKAQGQHFINHMSAMTVEDLQGKAEIAGELAHRDILIEEMIESLEAMLEQYDQFQTDCISAHEMSHRALAKARGEPSPIRPFCEKCNLPMRLDGCYVCDKCGHKESSF